MTRWPHAPNHILEEPGAYIVTCGIYQKQHLLNTPERLSLVQNMLFAVAEEFGWKLQAWAILSNHYHFVATTQSDPKDLSRMLSKLHTLTAKELNLEDSQPGRKVWHQFWDSHITFPGAYFARLKYVHHNPSHHGVVENYENYEWCSAAWFARTADPAFYKTVNSFKVDRLKVRDEF